MAGRSMPMNLITVDELVEKLEKFHCPLSGDDVRRLVHEDRIPYFAWVIPGPSGAEVHEPLFQLTATKSWLMENDWLAFREGDPPATPDGATPLSKRVETLEEKLRSLQERMSKRGERDEEG